MSEEKHKYLGTTYPSKGIETCLLHANACTTESNRSLSHSEYESTRMKLSNTVTRMNNQSCFPSLINPSKSRSNVSDFFFFLEVWLQSMSFTAADVMLP